MVPLLVRGNGMVTDGLQAPSRLAYPKGSNNTSLCCHAFASFPSSTHTFARSLENPALRQDIHHAQHMLQHCQIRRLFRHPGTEQSPIPALRDSYY